MDLRQIRTFCAVAELGSLSGPVAQRVVTKRPGVSLRTDELLQAAMVGCDAGGDRGDQGRSRPAAHPGGRGADRTD